jgi:hypothetical protein
MRSLTILLLLPALLLADDAPAKDEKPAKKTGAEIEIPEPGTAVEDSSVARGEVSRFEKEMRETKDPAKEVELIDRLGGFDHPEMLKALTKYVKDKELTVAVAAIVAVARQSKSKEGAARLLLSVAKSEKRTDIVCAAIVGMGKLGYDNKAAIGEAQKLFQRDKRETHKAAIRYFGFIKYKPAFRQLAEELDEPHPANPNDPNNPPESYWKERWQEWNGNIPYTRWALSQIVAGETFEKTEEAKQWAETEGKKYGIEW